MHFHHHGLKTSAELRAVLSKTEFASWLSVKLLSVCNIYLGNWADWLSWDWVKQRHTAIADNLWNKLAESSKQRRDAVMPIYSSCNLTLI